MKTDIALELFEQLLEIYTIELNEIEIFFKNASPKPIGDPIAVFNSRILTYDEYLGYEFIGIKQKIIPILDKFIAVFELLSEEEQKNFDAFNRNMYSRILKSLVLESIPFIENKNKELKSNHMRKLDIKIPFPPKNKRATRQLAEYRSEKKRYEEETESISNIIKELEERRKAFEDFQRELQEK